MLSSFPVSSDPSLPSLGSTLLLSDSAKLTRVLFVEIEQLSTEPWGRSGLLRLTGRRLRLSTLTPVSFSPLFLFWSLSLALEQMLKQIPFRLSQTLSTAIEPFNGGLPRAAW